MRPDRMPTIETPRLVLRPPIEADLDAYLEIHGDPDVQRHLTMLPGGGGRAAAWRTLALVIGHWHLRGYGHWTLLDKATGAVVGRAGLWNPEGWPGLEAGWVIGRPHWGRGLAGEAARASVEFAFRETAHTHVISLIQPDNERSIRVARKVGMVRADTMRMAGTEFLVFGLHKPAP